jgi:hypothetical protein
MKYVLISFLILVSSLAEASVCLMQTSTLNGDGTMIYVNHMECDAIVVVRHTSPPTERASYKLEEYLEKGYKIVSQATSSSNGHMTYTLYKEQP